MNSSITLDFFLSGQKPAKVMTRWDKLLPGLGIRVNRDGSSVFIVKYRYRTKQVMKTLGGTNLLSLDDARKLAARAKLLAKNDDDPSSFLSGYSPVDQNMSSATFGEFAKIYIDRHAREHKKSWKKDKQRIEHYLLPVWSERPLNAITKADVALLHYDIGKHAPYGANRTIEQLRVMFKLAALWGFLPEGSSNPAIGHRMYRERSRDRFITKSEMPRVLKVVDAYPDVYVRAALRLDFATGLRVSELLNLRWDWVDLEQREIHIPDTKAGRPHHQMLSAEAMDILVSLPKVANSPYVFPGRFRGTRLSRLDKAWAKIRKEAGIPDVTLHDVRRTFGSIVAQQTGSLPLVAAVLNQSTLQAASIYARFCRDHVRAAVDRVQQELTSARQKEGI